jgi:hypothetical protein
LCAAGRNLADTSVTSDCRCRTDENLSLMPLTNPGINYVIDSVLATAFAYSSVLANCSATANALNLKDPRVLCSSDSRINGSVVAEILRVTSVVGMTGKVQFTKNYRRFAQYAIYQYNGEANRRVGYFSIPDDLSKGWDSIVLGESVFQGKSGFIGADFSFVAMEWNEPAAIGITVVTTLGLVLTLATTGFVVAYQNHPVIKRASPLFCAFMVKTSKAFIVVRTEPWRKNSCLFL